MTAVSMSTPWNHLWFTGLRVFLDAEAAQRKSKGIDRITELGQFRDLSESSDDQKNGYITS